MAAMAGIIGKAVKIRHVPNAVWGIAQVKTHWRRLWEGIWAR